MNIGDASVFDLAIGEHPVSYALLGEVVVFYNDAPRVAFDEDGLTTITCRVSPPPRVVVDEDGMAASPCHPIESIVDTNIYFMTEDNEYFTTVDGEYFVVQPEDPVPGAPA